MQLNKLVTQVLTRIIQKTSNTEDCPDCLLWNGATYDNKYGKIRNPLRRHFENQPQFLRAHRLVYLFNHLDDFQDRRLPHRDAHGNRLDVSHLCHNTLCIRSNHLVLEKQSTNNSRTTCRVENNCNRTHLPHCVFYQR